jgi:hypothetical protein
MLEFDSVRLIRVVDNPTQLDTGPWFNALPARSWVTFHACNMSGAPACRFIQSHGYGENSHQLSKQAQLTAIRRFAPARNKTILATVNISYNAILICVNMYSILYVIRRAELTWTQGAHRCRPGVA